MKTKAINYPKLLVAFATIISLIMIAFNPFPVFADSVADGYDFLATRELYYVKGNGVYRVTPLTEMDKMHNAAGNYYDAGLYQDTGSLGDTYFKDMYVYYNTTGKYIEILYPNITSGLYSFKYRSATSPSNYSNIAVTQPSDNFFIWEGITYRYQRILSPSPVAVSWEAAKLLPEIPRYASREEAMGTVKQLTSSGTSATVKVVTKVNAGYTVKMPALFNLDYDNTAKRFQYEYTIGVKGCVDVTKILRVAPSGTFTVTNSSNSTTITGSTEQTITDFVANEPADNQKQIDYANYTDITGIAYLPYVTSGNWSGNLVFTFSVVDR